MRPRFILGVIAAFASLIAAPSSAQEPPRAADDTPYIEVTGMGASSVAPDRATITISVETHGPSAAGVAAENARIQRQVLDTLRALGFAGDLVSTLRYNVAPNYMRTETGQRQEGYIARNAVRVRLSELGRIGDVIDASLARGATGVGGVQFESSNMEAARREALAAAARHARAEAEALAAAMGGRLGALLQVSTGRDAFIGRMAAASGYGYMNLEPTQISPSEITATAMVVTRWRFVAGR